MATTVLNQKLKFTFAIMNKKKDGSTGIWHHNQKQIYVSLQGNTLDKVIISAKLLYWKKIFPLIAYLRKTIENEVKFLNFLHSISESFHF